MSEHSTDRRRYLLVLRFLVMNMVAVALLGAAYLQGWVPYPEDLVTRNMVGLIGAVFVFGLVMCAIKVWSVSRELNAVQGESPRAQAQKYLAAADGQSAESRGILAGVLRLRLTGYISIVRYTASTLVLLGLIGTVIGFILALSGVNPTAVSDANNVAPMVTTLIGGMSVALYTTLAGAVLHVWLTVNHRLLAAGAMHLYNAVVELGEIRARDR